MSVVDKQLFYDCFQNLLSENREDNSMYLTPEKYSKISEQIKIAKLEKKKSSLSIQYYITNEDTYNVLLEAHVNTGHGEKHRMLAELKKSCKNVTHEVVLLFLKSCVSCQQKLGTQKKSILRKPVQFSEIKSRRQVDLIDMQTMPDDQFQFIMVYQNYVTRFVQLRPLTSRKAAEVAKQLLDIFCIFAAHSIIP